MRKVLVMAGGTGGHVFPALAIAEALRTQHIDVEWLGTRQGIESKLVPDHGFKLNYLNIGGIRGKSLLKKLLAPWQLCKAILQAIQILNLYQPDAVIGLGGFASGPGGIAAWLKKIPIFIHEQNAIPGFTNRILAYKASKLFESFPQTFAPKFNPILTGNPIRTTLLTLPPPTIRFEQHIGPLRILVMGGSLGAQALNEVVPNALHLLSQEKFEILHQTGRSGLTATQTEYQRLNLNANVVPFIDDMAKAYRWADLVICRAGALTVSELAVVGKAAILVPLPQAADDHQFYNAQYLARKNAAICIRQSELSPRRLTDEILRLGKNPAEILELAKRAKQQAQLSATDTIVAWCQSYLS